MLPFRTSIVRCVSIFQPGGHCPLESVQVGEQVFDLLIGEHLAESGHLALAGTNHVGGSLVVCRCSTGHLRLLKDAVQAGSLERPGRISIVAARTTVVVYTPASCLLGVKAEFGVGFMRLHIASHEDG